MTPERISRQELDEDIAQTREVATRVSAALDEELRALADRARTSGATTTAAAVQADLDAAKAKLAAIQRELRELFREAMPALTEFDPETMHRFATASRAGQEAAEKIAAEIQELEALRAELR